MIDTANKRRASAGDPPIPDGALDSISDRAQSAGDYGFLIGIISYQPPNFILELADLDHILNLSPNNCPLILEDLDHDLKIH